MGKENCLEPLSDYHDKVLCFTASDKSYRAISNVRTLKRRQMSGPVEYLSHRYIEHEVPFCQPFVCQNRSKSMTYANDTSFVVLWECMPTSCKTKLFGFMSVVVLLSVFTTVFNAAVLIINLSPNTRRVFRRNPTMRNYSNYVISLSFTDLVIGVVVLPLAIIFFCQEMLAPRTTKTYQQIDTPFPNITVGPNTETIMSSREVGSENLALSPNATPWSEQPYHKITENIHSGSNLTDTHILTDFLGFLTQLCVFVSMYTLTAASIDRFYVSRRATGNPSIRLSSASLKTGITCGKRSFYPSFHSSRSGISVFFIWTLGVVFSWIPMGVFNKCNYQPIGHIFVVISFSEYALTLLWYIITLVLPLLLTWIFSGLLCYVLWRRKQRLKKCSRALQRQGCYSDRRTDEKEYDSSFALSTRCSKEESPAIDPRNTDDDDSKSTLQIKENLPSIVVDKQNASDGNTTSNWSPRQRKIQRPTSLALSPLLQKRKRPSSFDIFLNTNETKTDLSPGEDALIKPCVSKGLLKSHSFQNVQGSPLARRILLKVSWKGSTDADDQAQENLSAPASPIFVKRSDSPVPCSRPIRFAESPDCSPAGVRKSDIVRLPSSRMGRRRSSIFRAKEFMMSNTFESNVAKSLMAVVIALTFSTLPFLCVLPQLTPQSMNSEKPDISFLVSSVVVLLSNSLWNCLIYGARTRHFRTHLGRVCNKLFRCCDNGSSLTKQLSQIFTTRTSFFNTGNESK